MPKVNSDQIRDGAVHINHLADDIIIDGGLQGPEGPEGPEGPQGPPGSDANINQEIAARQEAFTLHIGADDPHRDRRVTLPLWQNKFQPSMQNRYYFPCSPFGSTTISTGQTTNRMYLTPMYTAEDIQFTWTALEVASTSGAGAIHRVGFYIIDDQENPFQWTATQRWASLWGETSPTYDCSTTGAKERQLSSFSGFYKNTWYAVADVGQVTTHEVIRAYGAPGVPSPLGDESEGADTIWTAQPYQAVYKNGVSGALPNTIAPDGGSIIGSCVALWRE